MPSSSYGTVSSTVTPTSTSSALKRKQAASMKSKYNRQQSDDSSNNDGTTKAISSSSSSSSSSSTKKFRPRAEESIEKMQNNLSRFARVSNKRMCIRTLHDCTYLRAIPLVGVPALPTQREEWSSLEDEVNGTNVQLNGLLFNGSNNNQVLKVLRALCQELCKGLRLSSESIYLNTLVRLAASTNSADAFVQLNSLLGSQDLVLQAVKKMSNPMDLPPTDVALYEAGGHVHGVVTSYISYGLFRRTDVKLTKPWIALLAQIFERVNFSTGASVRQVQIQITTPDL
ncbi:hypothetical protein ACA910_021145 [Epithemia clementina (nom. ined.)]